MPRSFQRTKGMQAGWARAAEQSTPHSCADTGYAGELAFGDPEADRPPKAADIREQVADRLLGLRTEGQREEDRRLGNRGQDRLRFGGLCDALHVLSAFKPIPVLRPEPDIAPRSTGSLALDAISHAARTERPGRIDPADRIRFRSNGGTAVGLAAPRRTDSGIHKRGMAVGESLQVCNRACETHRRTHTAEVLDPKAATGASRKRGVTVTGTPTCLPTTSTG